MTYEACLQMIQKAADERKLGIKTYCLLYLECLTVPEAIEKLMAATKNECPGVNKRVPFGM